MFLALNCMDYLVKEINLMLFMLPELKASHPPVVLNPEVLKALVRRSPLPEQSPEVFLILHQNPAAALEAVKVPVPAVQVQAVPVKVLAAAVPNLIQITIPLPILITIIQTQIITIVREIP